MGNVKLSVGVGIVVLTVAVSGSFLSTAGCSSLISLPSWSLLSTKQVAGTSATQLDSYDGELFWCDSCQRGPFPTERSLSQHRLAKHPKVDCELCDRTFASQQALDQHVSMKHPPNVHCCGYCDRSFQTRLALNQHMDMKHPVNQRCPACGNERFRSFTSAVQHLESGQCPNCQGKNHARGQVFQAIGPHLRGNMLQLSGSQHSGDDDADFVYECDQCNRGFRELNHLMQHKKAKHKAAIQFGLPMGETYLRRGLLPQSRDGLEHDDYDDDSHYYDDDADDYS